MTDLQNYYQCHRQNGEPPERFPDNHVKFSPLLKPLEWVDRAYGLFGSKAFKVRDAMLEEFDSAAPLDAHLGTPEDVRHVRDLVELFGKGIDDNPFISSIGRFLIRENSLGLLKNRRQTLQFYHQNRAFIDTNGKVKGPVIITGVPRSGTTLLHRLMSEDPNTRAPYTFEIEMSVPPMAMGANPLEDPRIKSSGAALNRMARYAPGYLEKFAESHYLSPTEREESHIFMLAHNGLPPTHVSAGKAYMDRFFDIEPRRSILKYEHLFFTMLDAFRPARSHWTLKAPDYSGSFPLLFEEYPDARVVFTHRNPLTTLPSTCRLYESMCIPFDEDGCFDKHRFGQLGQDLIKNYLDIPLRSRIEHPEHESQIFDCMYKELFADPIAMVRRIYSEFGLEYTEEFNRRMISYLEHNRQGRYGRHKYCLEEYGLDAEKVYEEYRDYMEHFGYDIPTPAERPKSFNFLAKQSLD
ncbi:MAG: sulfotransferase [Candidatus Woesearchaeota archaeon]